MYSKQTIDNRLFECTALSIVTTCFVVYLFENGIHHFHTNCGQKLLPMDSITLSF